MGSVATNVERSAATRARLLEAAVECLVEAGYQGTSTAEVCRRAGVTRGAQLHHYPTKQDLLGAAVEHVMTLRHAEFRKGTSGPIRSLGETLARLWQIYSGPTLAAWQELVVASRTDAGLRRVVARVDARFAREAEATFKAAFPRPDLDAAAGTRLLTALFDGLALQHIVQTDRDAPARVLAEAERLLGPWLAGPAPAPSTKPDGKRERKRAKA